MAIKSNKVGSGGGMGDNEIGLALTFVLETLIVWTEAGGTDMALSFQEPEGCAAIW
jgi:hypothetical protein